MRKRLHGYLPLTVEEVNAIWERGTIAFDANVALRLYELSPPTRDAFLELLNAMRDRIWLPFQAGVEYFRRRNSKIRNNVGSYGKLKSAINAISNDLESGKKHPFIDDVLLKEFSAVAEKVGTALKERSTQLESLIDKDSLLDRLEQLFEARLGKGFTVEELAKIYEEGATRFEADIPPGCEDASKPGVRKYGDLVIWKELIRHSKDRKLPLMFVTEDGKQDWWQKDGAESSAHPALRQEFKSSTGQLFCMYKMDDFMREAKQRGKPISDEAIEEVKEIAEENRKNSEAVAVAASNVAAYVAEAAASRSSLGSFASALRGFDRKTLEMLASTMKHVSPLALDQKTLADFAHQAEFLKHSHGLNVNTLEDFAKQAELMKPSSLGLDQHSLEIVRQAEALKNAMPRGIAGPGPLGIKPPG